MQLDLSLINVQRWPTVHCSLLRNYVVKGGRIGNLNHGAVMVHFFISFQLHELRAKRNGAFNIEYRIIDSTKVIKKLHEKADRVLIDAPCSGLGVLKRNPDAKWKLQPEFIENIKKTQAEVLENYSKIVKPGGKLVYATCSILPSENELQIKHFLTTDSGKNFTFVKDSKLLAHQSGFDGFYMALLERKL